MHWVIQRQTLMGLKGAISQIDWVLGLFVDETNKKDK